MSLHSSEFRISDLKKKFKINPHRYDLLFNWKNYLILDQYLKPWPF